MEASPEIAASILPNHHVIAMAAGAVLAVFHQRFAIFVGILGAVSATSFNAMRIHNKAARGLAMGTAHVLTALRRAGLS